MGLARGELQDGFDGRRGWQAEACHRLTRGLTGAFGLGTAAFRLALATDQFIEIAFLTAGGLVLDDQSEAALIELLEPVVPGDWLEGLLAAVAGEIEAEHSEIAPYCRFRGRRLEFRHAPRPIGEFVRDRSAAGPTRRRCRCAG